MKILKVLFCLLDEEDKIITKRTVGSNWYVDFENLSRKKVNHHIDDETSNLLLEDLKLSLQPSIIKEMLNEVRIKNE